MIRISYLPDARDVEASAGDTILHAALRAGIRLTHACGSNARCSTCRVAILEGLEESSTAAAGHSTITRVLRTRPMSGEYYFADRRGSTSPGSQLK